MTTSLQITTLPAPIGDKRISRGVRAYLRARYRTNVHSIVLEEFERSGLTNAQLARRLGMDPAQLLRLLGNPSNMTLDTLSDLLFAISGKEPDTKALSYGEMDKLRDEEAAYIHSAQHLTTAVVVLGMIDAVLGSASGLRSNLLPMLSKDMSGAGPGHSERLKANSWRRMPPPYVIDAEYKEVINA